MQQLVDEAGQIQLEQRVRTCAKALQQVFGTMPRRTGEKKRVANNMKPEFP
jgi:hypothetical protein